MRAGRRPGDPARVLTFHREGYRDFDERFVGDKHEAMLAGVAIMLETDGAESHPDTRLWFAERDGRALGCIGLVRRGRRGQLRWLVLLPEARGQGVGKRLIAAVLDQTRKWALEEVFLLTVSDLEPALSLYARTGFTVVREEETDLWHGRGREIEMAMAL